MFVNQWWWWQTPRSNLLLKIPYGTRNNFSKSEYLEVQHTQYCQPWSGHTQKRLKRMGLKGFQFFFPAGGARMSRADPVVWHVREKPWEYDSSSAGALCITSDNYKWRKPCRKLTQFCLCAFVLFMVYLASLWATQCIASNSTLISEEWTGKYVGGVGRIISNNTSVSTFTPKSKENLHLHEE
jgi:hypothetical protein